MTRRISTILILSLLVVAFVAMSAHAVKSPDESPRVINPLVYKSLQYAFPDASNTGTLNANPAPELNDRVQLGKGFSVTPNWLGVKIGDTYYDYQHNGRMTRMVDWGNSPVVEGAGGFMIHFEWMRLATEVTENRHYTYNVYYTDGDLAGTMLGQTVIQPTGEYAGYVSLDVTNDGRAVLGGHNNQGGGYQNHTYWDFGPGFAFFGMNRRVHDSVSAAGTGQNWHTDSLKSCIWPSIRYQEPVGAGDSVLHVFTQVSEPAAGDAQAIIYFRKVGINETGEWDYPPYVVDTIFDISQDVACSNTDGKVALVWTANLPDPGDCDTCSSQTGWPFVQWDNDVYYQVSFDYGASWQPRVNLTQNVDGVEGYRPYTDMQALITDNNDLHIVWGSRYWPADANSGGQAGVLRGRIFHWGENLAAGNLRTAADLEWDQTTCNGGAWQLNGAKMNVSECDGKLYVIWTQFNDIPNGIEDDCHNRAIAGTDVVGAANGDLYLAVSDDGGLTWDGARNLTNTRTPACDSATGEIGECRSEHWSSMNRHGTNLTGPNMDGVEIVDPSGGYAGAYFLDVQYIGDPDPGGIVQDEGTWQQADVRWFRLPCVEPVPTPGFVPSWTAIDYPEYTPHGTAYVKSLTIENPGNIATDYNMALNEVSSNPPQAAGWLTADASITTGVTIPSGTSNTVSGNVTINGNLAINSTGTIVYLSGNMTATGNFGEFIFPIDFWVVDTLIPPVFDTITTGCFSLVVSNMGNWGNQGAGEVNLDYFDFGDCDNADPGSAADTIPGDATIYVYDASPVICWTDATDTVRCNWSIFGTTYLDDNGFIPMGHSEGEYVAVEIDSCGGNDTVIVFQFSTYKSEFVTRDTGIMIEKWWYIPHVPDHQANDGSNFIVQVLKITVADGQTHTGLNIGEAIDWDIPSDSASRNRSGFNATNKLVYQFGTEYDDDPAECMQNSDRYGGIELLAIKEINGGTTTVTSDPYGAWSGSNALWVYPQSGYVPTELDSLMTTREGYVLSDSIDADLHSVMTFKSNYTLTVADTLWIYKCLITSRIDYATFIATAEDCHTWYASIPPLVTYGPCGACCADTVCTIVDGEQACSNLGGTYKGDDSDCDPNPCLGCCNEFNFPLGRGDVDYFNGGADDALDISDLVYLVDYMFTGGPLPPCWSEANVDGSDADADGEDTAADIDISDLVYMVDFMFTGGPQPLPCP